MENHTIKCLNPDCIGGRIETTMEPDSGYSNWTVMDSGFIEFKCHGCGKFASTDTYKKPNNPENFEVECKKCGSHEWSAMVQDVDREDQEEDTHIECKNCKSKTFELPTNSIIR